MASFQVVLETEENTEMVLRMTDFKTNNAISVCLMTAASNHGVIGFISSFENLRKGGRDEFHEDILAKDGPGKPPKLVAQTEDDSDTGDDDDMAAERHKIRSAWIETKEVEFDSLVEPDGKYKGYRVRKLCEEQIEEMAEKLSEKEPGPGQSLSSVLTVMILDKEKPTYLIIDGNHRYQAMRKLQEEAPPGTKPFRNVLCAIYSTMTERQALALGFSKNNDACAVYKMTDFDCVELMRKLSKEYGLSPGSTDKKTVSKVLEKVFSLIGAKTVSSLHLSDMFMTPVNSFEFKQRIVNT